MKINKIIKTILLSALPFAFSISCQKQDSNKKEGVVVSTITDFKNALSSGSSNILVDDIDFQDEIITINRDVRIESIDNESHFKRLHIKLSGPIVTGELIDVYFGGIIFDGAFDDTGIDLESETSFVDKFGGDREDLRCITADNGYFALTLDDCTIKNYASECGAAIMLENYNLDDYKYVNLSNCKVYHNYSETDTIHLSHGKLIANITSSEFYGNYAYKGAGFSIANGSATIDKVNVHDNIFVPYDVNQSNMQLCGGGIFIGGTDLLMTDSFIVNNKTVFGGGLGVSAAFSGNKNVVFKNVTIKNNEAVYGGGIAAFSMSGQPITFIDSEILCNKATNGGALYTEVYARWIKDNNGGLIQFFFTTFGLNTAEDNGSYSFYQTEATKGELGSISLKGCFSISNDVYDSKSEDYNYIVTKEQALLDGVINQNDIDNAADGLYPQKSSKADIKVSHDIYSKWATYLEEYEGDLSIGKNQEKAAKQVPIIIILAISIPGVIIIGLIVVIVVLLIKRKNKMEETVEQVKDEKELRKEYLDSLGQRERQVVEMIVAGKKRKDIANELNYSENTIKKDLTLIYSKLHVKDKVELIMKYRDLL